MEPIWYTTVDSTNEECFRNAVRDDQPPFVVAADQQTAGRGKQGSQWLSGPGGLYFSWYLGTERERSFVQLVTIAGVLGIWDYLEDRNIRSRIKWPNDLFLGERKICGILGEQRTVGKRRHLVLGTGLNLQQKRDHFISEGIPAGSIYEETGTWLDPREELPLVLGRQDKWFRNLEQNPEAVKETYLKRVDTGKREAEFFLGKV